MVTFLTLLFLTGIVLVFVGLTLDYADR